MYKPAIILSTKPERASPLVTDFAAFLQENFPGTIRISTYSWGVPPELPPGSPIFAEYALVSREYEPAVQALARERQPVFVLSHGLAHSSSDLNQGLRGLEGIVYRFEAGSRVIFTPFHAFTKDKTKIQPAEIALTPYFQ